MSKGVTSSSNFVARISAASSSFHINSWNQITKTLRTKSHILLSIALITLVILVLFILPPSVHTPTSHTSTSSTITTTSLLSTLTFTKSSSSNSSKVCLDFCSLSSTTTTSFSNATASVSETTTQTEVVGRRLGFWLQESDLIRTYSPQQFFNQYFLTPPYPSSLEIMIFATMNRGVSLNTSISYWSQVAYLADNYPNIEITPMLSFGINQSAPSLQYWPNVQRWINSLKVYPSIYSFGIEGEFSTQLNASDIPMVSNYINQTGRQFINYYLHSNDYTVMTENGGFQIGHTNFPDYYAGAADQVSTLVYFGDQYSVGISVGVYYPAQFPGTVTCPISANAINSTSYGYNQCVVDTIISADLAMPLANRQFLNLVPGFSYPKFSTFPDTAGIVTDQMWDNPVLRGWIWNNPSYTDNFLLSSHQIYLP